MLPLKTLVDARWVGHTGIGRVTGLFLRGLDELPGDRGGWQVWTRPDAQVTTRLPTIATAHSPTAALGQRDLFRIPAADRTLWMHAVRPVRRPATAVFVHDLIPLTRYPQATRPLWRGFFMLSVRGAARVLVDSEATAARVAEDLSVARDRIRTVALTVDPDLVEAVRAERSTLDVAGAPGHLLYVGQLKAHKNVAAAIRAHAIASTGRDGREFVIVGGTADEVAELHRVAAVAGIRVRFVGRCSDAELVHWMAGAAAVVQPSLEEGFGLTVLEALAAGIPVACSDIAPHREASRGLAHVFDPTDLASIATALDAAVSAQPPPAVRVPTPAEFAADVLAAAALDDR